jgi:hypothetical protein
LPRRVIIPEAATIAAFELTRIGHNDTTAVLAVDYWSHRGQAAAERHPIALFFRLRYERVAHRDDARSQPAQRGEGGHMRRQPRARGFPIRALSVSLIALASSALATEEWTPPDWKEMDTLEMRTTGPEEGEHWSKLWLVVIDDQLYVRLGSKATERVDRNVTRPYVSIRIAGKQFDRVRGEHRPDFRDRVANAMSDKYWSDFFIRLFPHPMTLRLTPELLPTAAAVDPCQSVAHDDAGAQ